MYVTHLFPVCPHVWEALRLDSFFVMYESLIRMTTFWFGVRHTWLSEELSLVGFDTVQVDRLFLTFWRAVLPLSWGSVLDYLPNNRASYHRKTIIFRNTTIRSPCHTTNFILGECNITAYLHMHLFWLNPPADILSFLSWTVFHIQPKSFSYITLSFRKETAVTNPHKYNLQ
jgi:hypothetical protein